MARRRGNAIQTYRTERGAQRYADEIMAKFKSVTAKPVVTPDFKYAVSVRLPTGATALAGKRPVGYGAKGYEAIMQGNFRILGMPA